MEITVDELKALVRVLSGPQPQEGGFDELMESDARQRALRTLGAVAGIPYSQREALPSFLSRVANKVADLDDLSSMQAKSNTVLHDDLGELLNVLGMGDHARPESSHEVMQQAIAKVRELKAEVDRDLATPDQWLEACQSLATSVGVENFPKGHESVADFIARAAEKARALKTAAGITWDDYELDSRYAVFRGVGDLNSKFWVTRGETLGDLARMLARYEQPS